MFTANSKQYFVIIENGECTVPGIAMSGEFFTVGVYGGADALRLTTDTVRVRVEESVRQKPPYDVVDMYEGLEDAIEALGEEDVNLQRQITGLDTRLVTAESKIEDLEEVPAIADEALTKANRAVADAAAAQETADQAITDAADAQRTANQGVSDAATAQETAGQAIINAGRAQDTADQAVSDAAGAQRTADQAVSDAADAQTDADTANNKADTLAARLTSHEGLSIASPNGVHSLRFVTSTGKLQIYDPVEDQWTDITSGSGGEISVDDVLSAISLNPVQNRVLTNKINEIIALIQTHEGKVVSDTNGVHGLRKKSGADILQTYDAQNDTWRDVSAPTATGSSPGVVQPDEETIMINNGVLSTPEPAAQSALTSISPSFSSTATYSPGDYVTYGGNLYQFINDHTGAWDDADVAQTTVGDEIEALAKSAWKYLYGLNKKTTTISTVNGNKQIVETDTQNNLTATTVIVKTSDTVTTITSTISKNDLSYDYVKTTVITDTGSGKTITENYTIQRS